MPQATLLLDEEHAKEWLRERGVVPPVDNEEVGTLDALIFVARGMEGGQPSVMLALRVDGKLRLCETSLQLLETATSAMRARSGMPRSP